jgi:hypothetical protein
LSSTEAASADDDSSDSRQPAAATAVQQPELAVVLADALDGLARLMLPGGNLRSSLGSDSDRRAALAHHAACATVL